MKARYPFVCPKGGGETRARIFGLIRRRFTTELVPRGPGGGKERLDEDKYEAGVIKSETGVIFLQPLGADYATMSHMKGI